MELQYVEVAHCAGEEGRELFYRILLFKEITRARRPTRLDLVLKRVASFFGRDWSPTDRIAHLVDVFEVDQLADVAAYDALAHVRYIRHQGALIGAGSRTLGAALEDVVRPSQGQENELAGYGPFTLWP